MSLLHGRAFDGRDVRPNAAGLIINETLATYLFGRDNPIDRRLRMSPQAPMQPVVGVVRDARQTSPRDRGLGVIYLLSGDFNRVVLAVRTAGYPPDAVPVIRHQIDAMAGALPIENVRTIAEVLDEAIAQERFLSAVALVLAALVIAIGCVGLYALLSYEVAQRTHELGVRLALGATSREVVALVLRNCAWLVLPALAIGLPLGMSASGVLSSQLYDVQPGDPLTLASVALLLALVALVATLRPARTASRIDPIALLRAE